MVGMQELHFVNFLTQRVEPSGKIGGNSAYNLKFVDSYMWA